MKPRLPSEAAEYLWWSQGAADEAKARDEDMGRGAIEVRETLEALARGHPVLRRHQQALVLALARTFAPELLKRRYTRNDRAWLRRCSPAAPRQRAGAEPRAAGPSPHA